MILFMYCFVLLLLYINATSENNFSYFITKTMWLDGGRSLLTELRHLLKLHVMTVRLPLCRKLQG